jgi:hypothetical protein
MNMQTRILVSDLSSVHHAALAGEWAQRHRGVDPLAAEELALRRERLERAEAIEAQELELRRRVEQDRRAVRDQLAREASKRFQSDRGGYRKRLDDPKSMQEVVKSVGDVQSVAGVALERKLEPGSALKHHPYRLYFNWPALREDRVTGKVG